MVKVAIISFYSELIDRGLETWAKQLKQKVGGVVDVNIFGGGEYGRNVDWQNRSSFYWVWLVLRHALRSLPQWSKSDVVVPTNGSAQAVVCRLTSWLSGKKMVIFGHSGLGADDKWNLLCSPNVFVAFSSYQKRWAERFKLPWTKIILIPHAVDTKRFSPARQKPGKKVVLCVASNSPGKRIDLVRKAVELTPGAEFLAVGKGNPSEASFEDMPEVYKKADVFCLTPNPWESFGLVFLEAMATNLPIVTTDDPIRREIVGNAGLFVDDPEDFHELSLAIERALKADWGDKPRRQAEKFSWDKIAQEYVSLFKSLV